MYKIKESIKKIPEPYQDEGDGADIIDTDVSDIDYPTEFENETEDDLSDTCSILSEVSNVPQYKNLESNLEEETDFSEINF